MNTLKEWDALIYDSLWRNQFSRAKEIWLSLLKHEDILITAIEVVENKWAENCLASHSICVFILMDSKNVKKEILTKLLQSIYNNPSIAQCSSIFDNSHSMLCLALRYPDYILTNKEKQFVESQFEAASNHKLLFNYVLSNPNWSLKEKSELIYKHFDKEEWMEYLDSLEFSIIDDPVNFAKDQRISALDFDFLYDYTLQDLVKLYDDETEAIRIMNEINFCYTLRCIRPKFESHIE